MNRPDVLVIIPSCGHFDYVKRVALSLRRVTQEESGVRVAYVIIDDASEEWGIVDWSTWPDPLCMKVRFEEHAGLTRSWNTGLGIARELGTTYAVCTNSDVLFSTRWFDPLRNGLDEGFDLIGPVTNAPGHAKWQNVAPFCHPDHPFLNDSEAQIEQVACAIRRKAVAPIEAPINGFFMMATTQKWWSGAISVKDVFDPRFPLLHNERELQRRWFCQGRRIGFAPTSYIFHYRSVSRPEGLDGSLGKGAYRATV